MAILQPLVTALTKVVGPFLAASALAAQEVPARASRRISSRHDVNRLERIVSRLVRLLDSMVLMVLMVVLSIPVPVLNAGNLLGGTLPIAGRSYRVEAPTKVTELGPFWVHVYVPAADLTATIPEELDPSNVFLHYHLSSSHPYNNHPYNNIPDAASL